MVNGVADAFYFDDVDDEPTKLDVEASIPLPRDWEEFGYQAPSAGAFDNNKRTAELPATEIC